LVELKFTRKGTLLNMEKLEKIVADLEKGDLDLDESVKKFEQGINISKKCDEILKNAEKKITILLNEDNNIKEENFDVNGNNV
jgi:exodeoxyribonuclease VII small subunit